MTFSRQILAGLALGILTGLFFGERAAALKWAADGFVKLLQMMVLPYITVSIVASLGSLRPAELRTLGLRAAAVIGGLWLLALAFAFLIPLTFPAVQNASFFSSSLVERRPAFDFVDLYIPGEPVQLPGEQRRAGRGPLLAHPGHRAGRCRTPGAPARRPAGRQGRDLGGHALRHSPDALRTVRDCGQRGGHAEPGAVGPPADLSRGVRRGGAAGQPVGAPGTGRRAHADSSQGCPRRVARLAHHRVHRRRSVHRAAGPHAGQPHAPRPASSRRRGAGPADGGHRAGLLQLPAHGEAPVPELHPLRRMVRRRAGAAVGLSAAGARRARDLLRQPHRGRAVSARPVPDSRRYVSAVSRDRRHQLARGIARGGGAHADGGAARRLRRHRPPSLAARTAPVVRRPHRRARRRGHRRHAPAVCDGPSAGVLEGQGAGVDAPAPGAGRRPPWRAPSSPADPSRTCRRSRPSTRARCCASATCPTRCRSRSSTSSGDLVGFDVELAHRLAREMGVGLAFVPVGSRAAWRRSSRRATATS